MQHRENIEYGSQRDAATIMRRIGRISAGRALRYLAMSAVLLAAVLPVAAQQGYPSGPAYQSLNRRFPDANQQMDMRQQRAQQLNFEAANALRQKILVEESVLLLKLAKELKSETDKASPDTLSQESIRKVEEIEKLAHDVKARMNLMGGGS